MSYRYPATTALQREIPRPHLPTSLSMMAGCWFKVHALGSAGEYPFIMGWRTTGYYDQLAIRYNINYDPYWQQFDAVPNYYAASMYKNNVAPPLNTWLYTTFRLSTTYCRSYNIDEDGVPNGQIVGVYPTSETTPIVDSFIGTPVDQDSSMSIAELWWASPDPFAHIGNNNLPEPILRHIAYHSPWSLPEVAGKMIWYNSFRQGWNTAAPGDFWINTIKSGTTISENFSNSYVGEGPPISAACYTRPYNLAPPPLIV